MKKTCFLLLLALTLALAAIGPALAEEGQLPKAGDELSGFVVQSVAPVGPLGATSVLFEHVKTGARLVYLATEDTNRAFDITFRTPALDEMGKPHVFEHMTICGSQKYPDANLFFPFSNQTYSTFVNAYTYQGMTSYPVASLSEEQLSTMMDYYLSGVFSPLVYSEPRMVQREAWRYELADADAPLTVAGTVYSEMQGALTFSTLARCNNLSAIFKDGLTAHESGGRPEAIRKLDWKALTDFHDAYYHPSNALIVLYGKLDYARFLSDIDAYLSQYDRAEVYVEKGTVTPYTETLYETFDAPVEAGAQTENASCVYYSFALNDAELEDTFRLSLLCSMLSQESSALMRALREALPEANITVSSDFDAPTPYVSIRANGVNESDQALFVKTVDDCLEKTSAEGFAATDVDAVLSVQKLSLLLSGENQDLGISASQNIALGWTYFGRTDYYSAYETVVNETDADALLATLNRWMTNNRYRAVSLTRPAPGLAEENAAALEEELAQAKAAMSPEEIDALVKQTADFAAWSAAAPSQELLAKLLTVTPETLPAELVHYDVVDETENGVRYLTSEAEVGGVGNVALMLDASGIPVAQLQDVALYLDLLGELDTDQHTREELDSLTMRYMTSFMSGLSASNVYEADKEPLYNASFSYLTLREDVPTSVALLREMLLSSNLSDTETIRQHLSREMASFVQTLDENILSVQAGRLMASVSTSKAYNNYLSDFAYQAYLKEMLALDDAALTARLEAAREIALNRHGATVLCAGDAETIAAVRAEMATLVGEFPDEAREMVDYSVLSKKIGWEAVTVNSTVQMNLLIGPADSYSGKDAVIGAVIDDTYLLPQLRNALGAYGAYSIFTPFYQGFYTYRDPNLLSSFKAFEALPEYLRTAEITQEMVDSYIVGSYVGLSRPQGKLTGALSAIMNRLTGLTEETRLGWMAEARQTTVADVRAMAERIQKLVENGARSTSATASTIEENKELFSDVVKLED